MIPYFETPVIQIGPLRTHVFSILVIVAILVGRWIASWRARRLSLDRQAVAELCVWMLIAGFISAHFARIILPPILAAFLTNPAIAMQALGGIRSLPALGGGLLGGILWSRLQGLPGIEMLRLLDVIAYALPFAWIFGRLGCFMAHDHRGVYTNSWIGVQFPEGTRYDLGLTEVLFLIPFAVLFHILGRSPKPAGFFFGLYGLGYGLYRVWQDTLHIQAQTFLEGRYGDTVGGSITCLVGLVGWAMMARHTARAQDALAPDVTAA